VRRAYPHLLALRGGWRGTIDDGYCTAWRKPMLAAGATEQDIDVLAVYMWSCWPSRKPNAAHPIARTSLSAFDVGGIGSRMATSLKYFEEELEDRGAQV